MTPTISICIPTNNRMDWVIDKIKILDGLPRKKFEIVILNEPDTEWDQSDLQHFSANIKYVENEKYLGYSRSMIKFIQEASGKYLLFQSDEDYLIPNNIIELCKMLDGDVDPTYVASALKIPKKHKRYINKLLPEDVNTQDIFKKFGIYNETNISLTLFFWRQRHLTGLILKKSVMDVEFLEKFVSTPLDPDINSIMICIAIMRGPTLYTPKSLYNLGPIQISEHDVEARGRRNKFKSLQARKNILFPKLEINQSTETILLTIWGHRAAARVSEFIRHRPWDLKYWNLLLRSDVLKNKDVFVLTLKYLLLRFVGKYN
jgi:hypothetical protein